LAKGQSGQEKWQQKEATPKNTFEEAHNDGVGRDFCVFRIELNSNSNPIIRILERNSTENLSYKDLEDLKIKDSIRGNQL
tara:strand:+ start:1381 stop:1620 length:240 start_codon:yes stop_codon:yes gene_type:complete